MKLLDFGRASKENGLRPARFVSRSALPVSAACLVANAARETLKAIFGRSVSVRLLAPVIPDSNAWQAITAHAELFEICGPRGNAALILRPADALALAAAAFGEGNVQSRPLSPLESAIVLRAARALSACLEPLYGTQAESMKSVTGLSGYITYFELIVDQPLKLRVGIALSRDPHTQAAPEITAAQLMKVVTEVRVLARCESMELRCILDLKPGCVLPVRADEARLMLGDNEIARGECGALGERFAIALS